MKKIHGKFIPREISWLSFNERVLQEAEDNTNPVIERIRFLGIFSNNQDEFFRVRVAILKRISTIKKDIKKLIGHNPKKIVKEIQQKVIAQQKRFEKVYKELLKELQLSKIHVIDEKKLTQEQGMYVKKFFDDKIRPSLVPIILSSHSKFPYLKDKVIYLAVKLNLKEIHTKVQYALIEIPSEVISRFVVLPDVKGEKYIILLDDVIRYCLHEIFSIFNCTALEAYTIKLTRDAEMDIDNDISKSLLEKISKGLKDRKKGDPVRLVYDEAISKDLLKFIIKKIGSISNDNLIPGGRYHNFKDFMSFPNIDGPQLEFKKLAPLNHKYLNQDKSIFTVLDKKDVLLHFPYQSFGHFIDFLREAAIDPDVSSIKITLYRVAKDKSRVINALLNAAQNGKSVTVVIELTARFDEKENIYLSSKLQEEGVKVIFGVPGLKVHAKLCLITRKKGKKETQYACIGTGNFNENTARVYTDKSLLTADERITSEVEKIFKFCNDNYKRYKFKHLILSPFRFRSKLKKLIANEIKNVGQNKEAYIIIKVNSLTDNDIINKLYAAGNAGVKIKLIIRSECSLTPGIKGLSENIEAISIVGRYLEHSRVFIFCNSGAPLYYISSANLMLKNIDHRVEVTCPVYDKEIQKEIRDIIDLQLQDNTKARIINDKQKNVYKNNKGLKRVNSQIEIYNYFKNELKEKQSN